MRNIIDILKKVGAIITDDHFVGTSGLHFEAYVNKDALFPHTEEASEVGKLFALKFKDRDIEVVVAPALGGIVLSQWAAHHLSKLCKKEIFGVYTEKTKDGEQVFTRGYGDYVKGKRVLVIEDTALTGGSVMKVVNTVKAAEGNIVSVCVMINRDPENINSQTLGVSFDSLGEYPVKTYNKDECPLCKAGIPINTKVGHGRKFLEEQTKES
jgi:orotate phosphoribosyltransferase